MLAMWPSFQDYLGALWRITTHPSVSPPIPVRVAFAMTSTSLKVNQSPCWLRLVLCCLFTWSTLCCTVTLHFRGKDQVLFPEGSQHHQLWMLSILRSCLMSYPPLGKLNSFLSFNVECKSLIFISQNICGSMEFWEETDLAYKHAPSNGYVISINVL